MAPSWCQLPRDILNLILQRLPLPDCFTFHKVCQSWRSAFLDRRRRTRPPPLILVRQNTFSESGLLYSHHRGELFRLRSHFLIFLPAERIIGSSMGWLVTVSNSTKHWASPTKMRLLNPISKESIQLPQYNRSVVKYVALSTEPTSTDFILVVSGEPSAWCRQGDSKWTYFTIDPDPFIDAIDMVFHKGNLFILGEKGEVRTLAFCPQPTVIGSGFVPATMSESNQYSIRPRLVRSGGELFFVGCQELEFFKQVEEATGWVRVESLGERVLLIGNDCTSGESSCTQDLLSSGFEPNCIYTPKYDDDLVKISSVDGSREIIPVPQNRLYLNHIEWVVPQAW